MGRNGKGTTPLASLGACDQHSLLQLFLDGPRDKFLTLILMSQTGKGPRIPATQDPMLAYLRHHTLGDLMEAEQGARAQTLVRNQCPVRLFHVPALREETLGALMMHFMLETIISAELLGVNAFDQPAVEQSKRLARKALLNTATEPT